MFETMSGFVASIFTGLPADGDVTHRLPSRIKTMSLMLIFAS